MLRGYPAILNGDRLRWIGQQPDPSKELRVVVVADAPEPLQQLESIRSLLAETRGVLPRQERDGLDRTLANLRAEWNH